MVNVIISGCMGRMGKNIVQLAHKDSNIKITGATEMSGSRYIGMSLSNSFGIENENVKITDDLSSIINKADCIIEFTNPEATMLSLKTAVKNNKGIVIGTTGLNSSQIKEIENAAREIPIVFAPNMSVGINLLFDKIGEIAKKLSDYDIEIIEVHHKFKKDAPSGTAKKFAEIIAKATGADLEKNAVYGREGKDALRKPKEIGIHAVRAGDIVGEHTIIFSNEGERIEIAHKAHSRDAFASGAIKAVKFLSKKKKGFYTMHDVLEALS